MQTQTIQDKPYFTVTNNVSRVTFEYVRDHEPKTNGEICEALEAQGFKRTSVSSLLSQMVVVGLLRRDENGRYWTRESEYRSFSINSYRKAREKAKVRKPVAQTRAMKNYLPKKEAPAPAPQPEVKVCNSVEDLLNTLTVAQARELFDRLKKMFA